VFWKISWDVKEELIGRGGTFLCLFSDKQIEKDKMGGTYSTHERWELRAKI